MNSHHETQTKEAIATSRHGMMNDYCPLEEHQSFFRVTTAKALQRPSIVVL